MDNEQQSVSSDTELESGTQSNVSDVVQEVQCENLGAKGQEMLPLPPSDSVDSGNTVPSASTGHGPESGEVSEVQSLRVMFERMLNFQAEFVRVQAERDRERDAKQAERDRERDAKQAERDRERDAEQAERDQRLVAEFACMQAERDRERDAEQAGRDQRLVAEFAKQAERDRERDAKQAERDRRLHERDLQLMQTLEVMQSEIVSLKQKYETIPKTVQELSERVDSVQVANANIVEEISVLTNRLEQLEIDTTQVIENKVIEQVHKVENEVIKEIDQKVHAAIEARDVGSSADVQDLKRIVHKDIPLWQRSVDRRLAEMELSLRHDEARAYVTPARSNNDRHINTAVKNCDCETEQATNQED
ncbi:RNA-binding protein 25-like [Schistocerca piceifrons]|uniref:RNA-binding protein 25-like n=1 Tax=Schistocerca piceifrons TaxID=274613 RepID=UPI001F5E485D|nr:RNA-binding protein 25-like [Schistocerca piceifrons]